MPSSILITQLLRRCAACVLALVSANGGATTFIGFEVMQSGGLRVVSTSGSALTGSTLGSGVGIYGPRNNGAKVLGNYLMGGLSIKLFKGVQVFDNTIYGGPRSGH